MNSGRSGAVDGGANGPGNRLGRRRPGASVTWEPVIGLEMHVELDTRTKMFCGCAVTKGDDPNTHTCPVCLAHPGALPVVNRRAVEYAARIALALNCTVRPRNIFHRKNYFYPDLPKAYQISQYDEPLATEGWFEYSVDGEQLRCRINRVHMEEDAAKLIHAGGDTGRIAGSDYSMVDFNRGGTPLIEIVTEPDIPSPEAAREFLQQLRNLVIELGVSECNMEEGQIRWDANVSVRPEGSAELGTRTELKNMNSFRYLQQALDAEIPRQIEVLEDGGKIDQETLHFDPDTGTTTPLRSKEEAHDYRYFPEPDLVPLEIDPAWVEELRATQPELPAARVQRFMDRVRALARRRGRARLVGPAGRVLRRSRRGGGRRQAGGQLDDGRVPRPSQRRRPRGRPRPRHRRAPRQAREARRGRHRLDERRQGGLRAHDRGARGAGGRSSRSTASARSATPRSSRRSSPRSSPPIPPRSSSTAAANSRSSGSSSAR